MQLKSTTYDDAFFPNFWETYHLFQVLQTCMQTHRSWCARWLNTAIHTSLCMMWFLPSSRGRRSGGGLIGGGRMTWRSIWTHFGGERQGVGRKIGVGVVLIQLAGDCSRKDPFSSLLGPSQSLRWLLPLFSGFLSSPSLSGSVFTVLLFWWARRSSVFWISWLSCLLSSLLSSLLGRRGLRLVFRWIFNCASTPVSLLGPAWVQCPCDWSPSHVAEVLCKS